MPRPQTDIEAGRQLLLDTVEQMIGERGAFDLSMTDLAATAGMSPSNIYRFFESREALFEAVAENWFADKIAIMEEVTTSDLPPQEKMFAFFARRFAVMRERYREDPDLFQGYCDLGNQHFEVIRGYVDLGDHYLSTIVAEAMEHGFFEGLSIDYTVSLVNQMVGSYTNPDALNYLEPKLSEEKLRCIVNTIFAGLSSVSQTRAPAQPHIKIVS